MFQKSIQKCFFLGFLMIISVCLLFGGGQTEGELETEQKDTVGGEPAIPSIPEIEVEFGHEPYMDHTQLIIALDKGWTKEVGITITPKPNGRVIAGENCIPVFASGEVDVISGSVPLFLGASKQIPAFKFFVGADIFQGYALMAQPDAGYKDVQEFIQQGLSPEDAIEATVKQMDGKTFAFPPETAIKGFIDLCLSRGNLKLDDMKTIIAEDSKTVAMMISQNADFQVGGVPSRLSLETEGFKPIITSGDLAQYAEASPEAEELRAIFFDGWLAHDKYIENNYDTILRMASICWRINQFINEKPDEAIKTHVQFLNSKAGTNLTEEMGRVIYFSLDPFITFEEQASWFDDTNPISDNNILGSYINMWEEKGYFKEGEKKPADFSIARKIYREMEQYKKSTENQIELAKELKVDLEEKNVNTKQVEDLIEKAQFYYDIFDFLDSDRFAESAVNWAQYLNN